MDALHLREHLRSKHAIVFNEKEHRYFLQGKEFYSVTTILGTLESPFDEIAMAQRCSENQAHEYFGVHPADILIKWHKKNEKSKFRGTAIHEYIEVSLLNHKERFEEARKNPYLPMEIRKGFYEFKQEHLLGNDFRIIDLECRLASPTFRICGTFDALFYFPKIDSLFVFDWKSNEKFSERSDFCLLPPFSRLDKSKLTLYTLQTYIYKWILENEYNVPIKGTRIVWLNEEKGVCSYKPAFEYNPNFIEQVMGVCVERTKYVKESEPKQIVEFFASLKR